MGVISTECAASVPALRNFPVKCNRSASPVQVCSVSGKMRQAPFDYFLIMVLHAEIKSFGRVLHAKRTCTLKWWVLNRTFQYGHCLSVINMLRKGDNSLWNSF